MQRQWQILDDWAFVFDEHKTGYKDTRATLYNPPRLQIYDDEAAYFPYTSYITSHMVASSNILPE